METLQYAMVDILKSVGFSVKKDNISLTLHISRGPDELYIEITDPRHLFSDLSKAGAFVLSVNNLTWEEDGHKIETDFAAITFRVKKGKVKILGREIGIRDIYLGDLDKLEKSDRIVVEKLGKALQTIVLLGSLAKDIFLSWKGLQ